jgi:hypothetical protein
MCEQSAGWVWPHEIGTNRAFTAGSVITRNFHGCSPNEDGERISACSSVAHVSAESLRAGSNFLVA